MRALILLALIACAPNICEEPCQGQSAEEERAGGIVCTCGADFAAIFAWTMDEAVCAADRAWWAKNAPLPCSQPGGGGKKARP